MHRNWANLEEWLGSDIAGLRAWGVVWPLCKEKPLDIGLLLLFISNTKEHQQEQLGTKGRN